MKKADYGGGKRNQAFGLTIGSKGYAGMGADGSSKKDFWEYDPVSNIWIQRTNYPGLGPVQVTGFSIGTTAYLGTGNGLFGCKDFWEYNPAIMLECFAPSDLQTKNITSTSAKFKWEPYIGATGYKLRYKIATSGSWTLLGPNGQTKTVEGLEANMQYVWQIKSVCGVDPKTNSDWSEKQYFTTTARLSSANNDVPFSMYPNPAKNIVNIDFTLPVSSHVNIQLCDASGREITCDNLPNEMFDAGIHSISIDLLHFSRGIYFVQMIYEQGIINQKLIIH